MAARAWLFFFANLKTKPKQTSNTSNDTLTVPPAYRYHDFLQRNPKHFWKSLNAYFSIFKSISTLTNAIVLNKGDNKKSNFAFL